MRLTAVPRVEWVCTTCGWTGDTPPDEPCCPEPGDARLAGDRLYTIAEVADVAQVAGNTVRGWVNRGDLTAVRVDKVLRVRRVDLDLFLERNLTNGATT